MRGSRPLRHVGPLGALLVLGSLLLGSAGPAVAQAPGTLRLALVPQWVINSHRTSVSFFQDLRLAPSFGEALDRGVTEGVVFAWQRGRIQRSSLVTKPIRVLTGPEATALGGRGEFRLGGVQPPDPGSAWTTVQVVPTREEPGAVAVLEVGGDLATITQLVETILIQERPGEFREQRLALQALVESPERATVVRAPFGRPVAVPGAAQLFHGQGDLAFLVVRGQVDAVSRGDVTPNGSADVAWWTGDWRESDRVFIRVPLSALQDDRVRVVLAWRDRTLRDRPDGDPEPLRPRISRGGLPVP